MGLYSEARRRGIFRVAATYLVVSWIVLEVGYVLSTILGLPKPVMKTMLALLVLGFPVALALAWNFRFGDGGLLRHDDGPSQVDTEHEAAHGAGHEAGHEGGHGGHGHGSVGGVDPLPIIVGVMVLGGLVVLGVSKLIGGDTAKGPVDAYGAPIAAAAPGDAAKPALAPPATARVAPANSIAVLPFDNLSGDPNQAFFSDGMAEELRGALASVAGLQVAARTSSNAFRGTNTDVATIGARLGVAYTLEGSVRRAGDVVRVSAQLIEAKTGFERWSETYDRKVKDVFAIQSEIAARVTDALKVQLLPREQALLAEGATLSPAAHDAFLRGRQLYRQSGGESIYRNALAQFDAAIAADPDYAVAYGARAAVLSFLAGQFVDDPAEVRRLRAQALESARTGARLSPEIPFVQSSLGYVLELSALDVTGARAAYDKSMVAGSGDADLLVRYGLFNARNGDAAKGLAALEKAVKLDPVNATAWKAYAGALTLSHRYAEAAERQREALRLNPDFTTGRQELGNMLLLQGKLDEARAAYGAEATRWARLVGMAIIERRQGKTAAAEAAYAALVKEFPASTLYQQAQVLAQWGDKAGALAKLERALVEADPGLLEMRRDPLLDPLHGDRRFAALAARLTPG